MLRRADGSSKGAAFVKFSERRYADRAIARLHDQFVMPGATRPLQVSYAVESSADSPRQRGAARGAAGGSGIGSGSGSSARPLVPAAGSSSAGANDAATVRAKLFVGGLPAAAAEPDLWALFAPFGDLREVAVLRRADGTSKGAAFVNFATAEGAEAAVEAMTQREVALPGSQRPLVVRHARRAQQQQRRRQLGQ